MFCRIKPNVKEVEDVKEIKETAKSRRKLRRKQTSTTEEPITHSSLKVATPSYTTPEPPSTPDMGGGLYRKISYESTKNRNILNNYNFLFIINGFILCISNLM